MTKGLVHEKAVNETVEWYTPPWLFEALGIWFDLDPCHPVEPLVWMPVCRTFNIHNDGLAQPWKGRVWMNPPYGRETIKWMKKLSEHGHGIALVFARTDPEWFQKYAATADAICFLRKRIKFITPVNGELVEGGSPGAGSMLLAWGGDCVEALRRADLGVMVRGLDA